MRILSDIRITTSVENDVARVQVMGELDLQTRAALVPYIDELDPRHDHVLVDLSRLQFMDLAGLHGLVAVVCGEHEKRTMEVLPDYQPQVRRLLAMPEVEDLLCCAFTLVRNNPPLQDSPDRAGPELPRLAHLAPPV